MTPKLREVWRNDETRMLFWIFLLAVTLRMIMPLYLVNSGRTDFLDLMSYASHKKIFYYINALANSTGDYAYDGHQYIYEHYIQYAWISSWPYRLGALFSFPNSEIFFIQTFQGILDSLGCFLVYFILNTLGLAKHALKSAAVYAFWVPSIFYSYHLMAEAYTPFLGLSICLLTCFFLKKSNWIYFVLLGLMFGVLITLRADNLFAFPIFALMLFFFKKHIGHKPILKVASFILITLVTGQIIARGARYLAGIEKQQSYLATGLVNAMAEYPGNYKPMRIYNDPISQSYSRGMVAFYKHNQDPVYNTINIFVPNKQLSAFITRVIIYNPIMYINRVIARTWNYFSGHNYFGFIAFYLSKFPEAKNFTSAYNYSHSAIYHGFKVIDLFFFLLFALALVYLRKDKSIQALFVFYMGILISHSLTVTGEVLYFEGKPISYMNPSYLLVMNTMWPIFIPLGWERFKELVKGKSI